MSSSPCLGSNLLPQVAAPAAIQTGILTNPQPPTHSGPNIHHWVQEYPPHSLGYKTPRWAGNYHHSSSIPLPEMYSFLTMPGI